MSKDNLPDLAALKEPLPWFTLICRHPLTNMPISALRIAPGMVTTVEADGSINICPMEDFEVTPTDELCRTTDGDTMRAFNAIPNLATQHAMMQQMAESAEAASDN